MVRAVASILAFLAVTSGCSFVSEQVHVSSVNECIHKSCNREADAVGYSRCESACRSTYGK